MALNEYIEKAGKFGSGYLETGNQPLDTRCVCSSFTAVTSATEVSELKSNWTGVGYYAGLIMTDQSNGAMYVLKPTTDTDTAAQKIIGAKEPWLSSSWIRIDAGAKDSSLTISVGGTTVGIFSVGTNKIIDLTASQFGLGNAMHYIGKATVDTIKDSTCIDPSITGYTFESTDAHGDKAESGDVVLSSDGEREYVWHKTSTTSGSTTTFASMVCTTATTYSGKTYAVGDVIVKPSSNPPTTGFADCHGYWEEFGRENAPFWEGE